MNYIRYVMAVFFLLVFTHTFSQSNIGNEKSGNPIFTGWYADPEAHIFNNTYWVYPTYSDDDGTAAPMKDTLSELQLKTQKNTITPQYLKQSFLDAFSSKDLVHWEKKSNVLDIKNVAWAAYAVWAPSITEKDGKYYLFFGANDIQNNDQPGGMGIAVSDKPGGPFIDYLGKPLIDKFYNGAQPIDPDVFRDTDGQYYLIYGGWKHCNIGKLNRDFTGFIPFKDGSLFKSITPDNYVEGPFMFVRNKKYYFMWSEGGWFGPDYSVAYAVGNSPFGPFKRVGKILQQDSSIATGAGHHSVLNIPGTDDWFIIYHRRPLNTTNGNHREVCIDRMYFDKEGNILPVKMTKDGVAKRLLAK
ncbi:MAG: glycoside hydrolase family 43 protein [Ginsengibacter sp.]